MEYMNYKLTGMGITLKICDASFLTYNTNLWCQPRCPIRSQCPADAVRERGCFNIVRARNKTRTPHNFELLLN